MVLTTETAPVLTTLRALIVCKFSDAEAAVLVRECFPNFDVYLKMKEKDISNIVDDYASIQTHRVALSLDFTAQMSLKG
jgi:hypothetical protein